MTGTIYLVATPIGNLDDLSPRAITVLKQADRIACEDTRHSGKLLRHFEIDKPLLSYHEHNENKRAKELIRMACNGEKIAVICDAGMPGISDPGYRVVHAAIDAGVPIVPIPGPTAVATALAASGLPTDRFRFEGFLPSKKSLRRKALEALKYERSTTICYETSRRICDTLADIAELFGARPVVVARELTKLHEEFLRGTARSIISILEQRAVIKGEITLLIGGGEKAPFDPENVTSRVATLLTNGVDRMDAIKQVAREFGVSKSEVYRLVEDLRSNANKV